MHFDVIVVNIEVSYINSVLLELKQLQKQDIIGS